MSDSIRFIDLFGGIGGFRLGLEQASDRYECVDYIEYDDYAVNSYNEIFEEEHESKDVTELDTDQIPEHDLICAGFPCQSFSVAGDRKGLDDTRGTLFFEIARIAKDKQPNMLLLENVRGLLSHNEGETFKIMLQTLNEVGYYVDYRLLNSKNFGVPQNRQRVFITGFNIKWLAKNWKDKTKNGQNQKNSLSEKTTKSFLLESLLKSLEDQEEPSEVRLKEWGLDYLLLKELKKTVGEDEIYGQNPKFSFFREIIPSDLMKRLEPKSEGRQMQLHLNGQNSDSTSRREVMKTENTSNQTDTIRSMTEMEIDDSITRWLRKICSAENSRKKKSSTTSTSIKPITEKETYSSAEINLIILGFIIKQRDSLQDWLDRALSNLMKKRGSTSYEKRRETEGSKGTHHSRSDFYSLELGEREVRQGVELEQDFGEEPEGKVFPLPREDREDTGEDGREVEDSERVLEHRGHEDKPVKTFDVSPTLRSESHGHQPKVLDKNDGLLPALNGGWTPQIQAQKGLNTTSGGDSFCIDASYWKGVSPSSIEKGRRTQIVQNGTSGGVARKENMDQEDSSDSIVNPLQGLTENSWYWEQILYSQHTSLVRALKKNNAKMQPKVIDETYGFDDVREYDDLAPNLRSERTGLKVLSDEYVKPVHTPEFAEKDMNMKSRVGSSDGSMFTVDGSSQHGVTEGTQIRKLTPKECWRLQGFPDWAFNAAQKENSDTQLYKQAGNSVTVNVIEAIGEEIEKVF